ncbi:MAG TPA: hypothetical protein VNF04_18660 [Stellaceae bacterium]|nr:hypothetical protein [Stellaceae bacterium]
MHPALEKRLKRLQSDLHHAEGTAAARRSGLRALVEVGRRLRRMVAERGVDPAGVAAFKAVDEAAAALAALPCGSAARAAEAAWLAAQASRDPGDDFCCRLVRLALLHFADGKRPDPAHASLMEWHAWCLLTPASRHDPNILADPAVQLHQRMLRLGGGDPAWRQPAP